MTQAMKQCVAVITLPVADLAAAKTFYCDGLGWSPLFDNGEVMFFQFNGFVFALWLKTAFEADMEAPVTAHGRTVAIAHNVVSPDEVDAVMTLAAAAGARVLRAAKTLSWGGYSGYFADPDGHVWEVAHNPAWELSPEGHTRFKSA